MGRICGFCGSFEQKSKKDYARGNGYCRYKKENRMRDEVTCNKWRASNRRNTISRVLGKSMTDGIKELSGVVNKKMRDDKDGKTN